MESGKKLINAILIITGLYGCVSVQNYTDEVLCNNEYSCVQWRLPKTIVFKGVEYGLRFNTQNLNYSLLNVDGEMVEEMDLWTRMELSSFDAESSVLRHIKEHPGPTMDIVDTAKISRDADFLFVSNSTGLNYIVFKNLIIRLKFREDSRFATCDIEGIGKAIVLSGINESLNENRQQQKPVFDQRIEKGLTIKEGINKAKEDIALLHRSSISDVAVLRDGDMLIIPYSDLLAYVVCEDALICVNCCPEKYVVGFSAIRKAREIAAKLSIHNSRD